MTILKMVRKAAFWGIFVGGLFVLMNLFLPVPKVWIDWTVLSCFSQPLPWICCDWKFHTRSQSWEDIKSVFLLYFSMYFVFSLISNIGDKRKDSKV